MDGDKSGLLSLVIVVTHAIMIDSDKTFLQVAKVKNRVG